MSRPTRDLNTVSKGLAGGSDISVSGGSTTSNLFLIDGADNVDHGSNRTILVYPSVDAIEEFKIQRNNYGAEFGGAGGAQVNLVTRGGTNSLHGSAYYYARRDSLNATDYFLKTADQEKQKLTLERLRRHPGWSDHQGQAALLPVLREEQGREAGSPLGIRSDARREERQLQRHRQRPCPQPAPIDPRTGQPFPNDTIPADRRLRRRRADAEADQSNPNVPGNGCDTNWTPRPSRRRSTGSSCTLASTGA